MINIRLYWLSVLISFSATLNGQPSEHTITKLRKATVRVQSGNRVGTGFVWNNPAWIVTTLHTLTEGSPIEVTYSNQVRMARLLKVLPAYDLALLEVTDGSSNTGVLKNATSETALNTNCYVLGYNGKGNLNTLIDRSLRLGYNSTGKLKGLLPKHIKTALDQCKSPDPDIDILYFDGNLLPGFSGAPIVNDAGMLVGIADGGLEEGASSISWGIRAKHLNTLATSTAPLSLGNSCSGNTNKVKFSSESIIDTQNISYVIFGEYTFVKVRTRTIQEMQYTVDDPQSLQQLLTTFTMNTNTDYLSFAYDIYEDAQSGATLCVPSGARLVVEDGFIKAQLTDSRFAFIAWTTKVPSGLGPFYKYKNASDTYDRQLLALSPNGLLYEQDTNFSYLEPTLDYNGSFKNRLAFLGYYRDDYGQVYPQTYVFQTHIGNGNTYLGVSAINFQNDYEYMLALTACATYGGCLDRASNSQCAATCAIFKAYSKLALGVFMSGFSNKYGD